MNMKTNVKEANQDQEHAADVNEQHQDRLGWDWNTVNSAHQSDKQVIENEVDGDKRRDAFTRLPHRAEHNFIPAFLCQDLKHRHHALTDSHNTNTYQLISRDIQDPILSRTIARTNLITSGQSALT